MADKQTAKAAPGDPKAAKDSKVAKGATHPDGDTSADGAAQNNAPKKSRAKLFIILAAVLVLLGGGGAGAFFMLRKPVPADGQIAEKKPEANGIVTFEPFVVNLADPGKRHYLRINIRLLVGEAEAAEHIQKSEVLQTRLRADILELLTEQTSEIVASADGKAELKKNIAERAHHILEKTEIADVLFSDFIVQ